MSFLFIHVHVYLRTCTILVCVCLYRMEVCSLLLSHGADPTIPNCHSKTALDLATSDQNRERLDCKSVCVCVRVTVIHGCVSFTGAVEFKGYQLLNAAERGDISRAKKLLTCTPSLTSFQHMLTMDSALVSEAIDTILTTVTVTHPPTTHPLSVQHCATSSKRKSLVELLIKRGADVSMQNKQ